MDLLVDRCPKCFGVWLDNGELQKVGTIAEHLQSPKNRILRVALQMKHHQGDFI
jgi:Zn-finger nucleic acid-binding protein